MENLISPVFVCRAGAVTALAHSDVALISEAKQTRACIASPLPRRPKPQRDLFYRNADGAHRSH